MEAKNLLKGVCVFAAFERGVIEDPAHQVSHLHLYSDISLILCRLGQLKLEGKKYLFWVKILQMDQVWHPWQITISSLKMRGGGERKITSRKSCRNWQWQVGLEIWKSKHDFHWWYIEKSPHSSQLKTSLWSIVLKLLSVFFNTVMTDLKNIAFQYNVVIANLYFAFLKCISYAFLLIYFCI